MNTIKQTRFYLGISLFAHYLSRFAVALSAFSALLALLVFLFDYHDYDHGFLTCTALSLVCAWGLRKCATTLTKQYGLRP